MQVLTLEATLFNVMQGHVRLEHRAGSPFTFFVRISAPNDSPSDAERKHRKDTVGGFLTKYKLAGTSFTIEDIN